MDEDPLVFLQNCSKEDIITFLKWLNDNYRIKKLDSSHEYKENLPDALPTLCRPQPAYEDCIRRQ